MSTIEGIINAVRGLPRADADDVRKRLAALLQFSTWGAEELPPEPAAMRVFDLVRREMRHQGLVADTSVPYRRLENKLDFANKAKALVSFMEKQHQERRVQDGILNIGIRLLIEGMRRSVDRNRDSFDGIVSINEVCRRIHNVPARLDREFPGYGSAGLLHILVKSG